MRKFPQDLRKTLGAEIEQLRRIHVVQEVMRFVEDDPVGVPCRAGSRHPAEADAARRVARDFVARQDGNLVVLCREACPEGTFKRRGEFYPLQITRIRRFLA
jgi:hypothetical protein